MLASTISNTVPIFTALAREVGVMYFLLVIVVLASLVAILAANVHPKRVLDWLMIAWAAAIADVIVLGVSSSNVYALRASRDLVLEVGLPGFVILGPIWLATRPRGS